MSDQTSEQAATRGDRGKILVSGASIAGLTTAYWLRRYGFSVVVVEKAETVRAGGYPIDIRGTAVDVVERMGLLPRLRDEHIDCKTVTFLDECGESVASLPPEWLTGGKAGRDIEVPRGVLTSLLFDQTRDNIDCRFRTSIESIEDSDAGVDVLFDTGQRETFDLVVGADGIHSNTRKLAFGPEAQFNRYLGFCFAGFAVPNVLQLSHEVASFNQPGRMIGLYAVRDSETVHTLMAFTLPKEAMPNLRNVAELRDLVAKTFENDAWIAPQLIDAMRIADDFYFDTISQIHMPVWSSGRVAVVGDAACAPSFLSGQGTSLALVSAYILAGEIAAHANHLDAFAAYQAAMQPFAEINQATATNEGADLIPTTAAKLTLRNEGLHSLATGHEGIPANPPERESHSAFTLRDYAPIRD